MTKKTNSFQAEVQEILNLMIHSLYSKREIFLRELISNASDAIDKLKFEILTNKELAKTAASSFEIRIDRDPANRTLTIHDNGIGMTKEEVEENIGTIAHSGTKAWVKMSREIQKNPELIGEFGVGFYSSFMVADKVKLTTQKTGTDKSVLWESDGLNGTYTIEEAQAARPEGSGTSITLFLKEFKDEKGNPEENAPDFTDQWTVQNLVQTYSDFVSHPIKMKCEETKYDNDGKDKKTEIVDRTLNSMQALWEKSPADITEKEYKDFYRHITHDWSDPLKWIHYKAEGTMEFNSIMYIPTQKPMNYDFMEYKHGLNLYVKRVFIMSDCEELIPKYLRFIKGMVDSNDLSLNVSREILQKDRQVARIKKSLTGKILSTLKDMLDKDRKNYETFWNVFGPTLKEGIALDFTNKEKLQDLFLFHSTDSDNLTTLKDYVDRMKTDQKAIYFITAENLEHAKYSPYLEKLKAKNYEVLLLTDRIDEWVTGTMQTYKDKSLQSVMSENLDIDTEEEKKENEKAKKDHEDKYKSLIKSMKSKLDEYIKEIKLSDRLTDSPVCLVSEASAPSAQMERIMKTLGKEMPKTKRILEINPKHPVFDKMLNLPQNKQEEWADILYSQALLNEGSSITNPLEYSKKIANLMVESGN